MTDKTREAPLHEAQAGLVPDGDGWFVVNLTEAQGMRSERFGSAVRFEGVTEFPDFGINIRVLQPGQPNCMYHREDAQEAFLVLSGECVAIVEEQERSMRTGDFLYTPGNTAHVLVGAGAGPCAILMAGARPDTGAVYPVSEVAARHGASVDQETSDPGVAYAGVERPAAAQLETLPW